MTGFRRRTAASTLTATVIQGAEAPPGVLIPVPLFTRMPDRRGGLCVHTVSVSSRYSLFDFIIDGEKTEVKDFFSTEGSKREPLNFSHREKIQRLPCPSNRLEVCQRISFPVR